MSVPVLAEKACTKCGEVKPLSEFHRDKKAPDGHAHACKPCKTAQIRAAQDRRKAELGEAEYNRRAAITVYLSRRRRGYKREVEYNRIRRQAVQVLIDAHRREFDALMERFSYEAEVAS